jgi:transposase
MTDVLYQPPQGFMTMSQAQERLGVSKTTLTAIVRRYGLVTHRDVRDSRVRLLRTEDVERIAQPMPEGKAKAA